METLADLVAAGRDRQGTAVAVPGRTTDYSYGDFCTDVWKSGNLLRHYGVRADAETAVAVGPKDGDGTEGYPDAADPLLAILGAAQLGGTVDLDPPGAVATRAFVCPAAWVERYDPAPGTSVLAYGGPPEAPDVVHFERERWSENPMQPPDPPARGDELLAGRTHGDLLESAERVVESYDLSEGDRVALRASIAGDGASVAGALAAGIVAPLSVGATSVLDGDGVADDAALVVGEGGLDPGTVTS